MTDDLPVIRIAVHIEGRVQGVFFRASAQEKANELGIKGWVKNNRDGSVSAVLEGTEKQVRAMIEWCKKGPDAARVDKVTIDETTDSSTFRSFEIHPTTS